MNMSSISDNGDFSTIVRLKTEKNYFLNDDITFVAIDGTFSEVMTDEGKISYIVVGMVRGKLFKNLKYVINNVKVKDEVCNCNGESRMRELEYQFWNNENADIVFFDRKLSYDRSLGISIPSNAIGIVKDFDASIRMQLNKIPYPPWLKIETKGKEMLSGYYKLFSASWVFYFESYIFTEEPLILLSILYSLGSEPIPEALGYNYPLFLADKLVKYYRNKMDNFLKMIQMGGNIRYREFRSWMEKLRNDAKYI